MLYVRNLIKSYGAHRAVDSINLDLEPGKIFGFLGPNGAGKTTTIRMLTGLSHPTSGDIFIDKERITPESYSWKGKIGVVSDTLSLFEGLTLWNHFDLVGPIYGIGAEDIAQKGEELLRFMNLWEERDLYVNQASYGMKKKLALALALFHKPKILFLDEALSGIDPVTGSHIRGLLKKLAESGVTIFITSHTLEVMAPLIDHYAIISKGKIVKAGRDLKQQKQSLEEIFIEALEIDVKLPELSWLF